MRRVTTGSGIFTGTDNDSDDDASTKVLNTTSDADLVGSYGAVNDTDDIPRELLRERINSTEPLLARETSDIIRLKNKKKKANEKKKSSFGRQQLITGFGWTFDFVTVAISLIDVVSDILVALQFMQDGHSTWAWLVFGCFINSNCIYSAMITELVFKDKHNDHGYYPLLPECFKCLPRPLLFVMVFPFAQLSPTINYVLQTFFIKHRQDDAYRSEYQPKVVGITIGEEAAEVAKQEQRAIEGSAETMGRLQDALKKQFHTHGMLFTETVVESIPQSIIQLLAITFLGSPSNLQVFSMSLSLLSVVSKAYFASVSCDLRIFIVKFLMVSHDVFSMFYVFCSLVSREGPKDFELFPGLEVSWISLVWFIKVFVVAASGVVCMILLALIMMLGHCLLDKSLTWEDVRFGFLFGVGSIFAFIPALLALETAKLSWLILILVQHEPDTTTLPVAAMLFSFLQGGATHEGDGNAATLPQSETQQSGSKKYAGVLVDPSNPDALDALLLGEDGHLLHVDEWRSRVAYFYGAAYHHLLTYGLEAQNRYRFGVYQKWYLDHTARVQLMAEGNLREAMLTARRQRPSKPDKSYTTSTSFDRAGPLPDDKWLDSVPEGQLILRDPILDETISVRLHAQWYVEQSLLDKATISHDKMLEVDGELLQQIARKRLQIENSDLLTGEKNELLHTFTVNKIYSHKRLRQHYFEKKDLINTHVGGNDVVAWFIKRMYIGFHVINGTCTLVSFLYPFINYGLYFHTQNLLQHVCFGLMAASLLFMLPLLPVVKKYVDFVLESSAIISFIGREKYSYDKDANVVSMKELGKHIASYHLPPAAHVLRGAISHDLVCADVLGVVERLLPANSIDLRKLTIAECRALKFVM